MTDAGPSQVGGLVPSTRALTQSDVSAALARAVPVPGGPALDFPPYGSSLLRHPRKALQRVEPDGAELWAPVFGEREVAAIEADLTAHPDGEPIGERITVSGRLLDGDGRPVAGQLVEVWQANAAGRYRHRGDQHAAPLDPFFVGAGRCLTDANGRYSFTTVKPGPYPWSNHRNAWRPAHLHFSVFGRTLTQRLVTQMYFPGDPLFDLDPVAGSVTHPAERARLVAAYDHDLTREGHSTGYRWDIVLAGAHASHFEDLS